MKQTVVSNLDPNWPGVEIDCNQQIELFMDSFDGLDINKKTFKIFYAREPDVVSNLKNVLIQHQKYFDAIIAHDEDILTQCKNSYKLEFGTTWIHDYEFVKKNFCVSHLTGQKDYTQGQRMRQQVYYKQHRIQIPKDFYISHMWKVENDFGNKILTDKKEPLFDSQFHICIENVKTKNYFSEKLIDCFMTKSIPIYYGCSNVGDYFDINGMILCDSATEIVEACNKLTPELYDSKYDILEANYQKALKYIDLPAAMQNLINTIVGNASLKLSCKI